MRLVKEFEVQRPRADAVAAVATDEALVGLFPGTETEIVATRGARRTARSRYRALGREGEATFHFTFRPDGGVAFEKVCDGRVWRQLDGSLSFEACGKDATLVRIEMEGKTKALVPEFTIKGPMQDQIEQMADALRRCIEGASAR
jgi:carbon monoxide dehydrogenase subunit G